ncbi:MAG: FkbM family methyltransferase [Acidobacteria bacterium]|nr:FkbM family methyltransferase [Acidobacteriota bacterium]
MKDAFPDQAALLSGTAVNTIFDVGAHGGQTALRYRELFPAAQIYSFEPFAASFAELCANFAADPSLKPMQLAISDQSGYKPFHVNRSSYTNSLLSSVEREGLYETLTTLEVPVMRIDDFCAQEGVNEIQILKMDIQGGELMALEGAAQMLSRTSIRLIYSEILFTHLYEGQAMFFQLCDCLSRYDYRLFDMYNLSYQANGQLAWGDAIFISPQIAAMINPIGT